MMMRTDWTALTRRTSLIVCLGYIAGTVFAISRMALPLSEEPSPLVVRPEGARFAARRPAVERAALKHLNPPDLADQFAVAGPFGELERGLREVEWKSEKTLRVASGDARDDAIALPVVFAMQEYVPSSSDAPLLAALVPAAPSRSFEADDEDSLSLDEELPASFEPETMVHAPEAYIVKPGDTLAKIARQIWNRHDPVLVQVLIDANPAIRKNPHRIHAGQRLRVPPNPIALEASDEPLVVNVMQVDRAPAATDRGVERWYVVRSRDSLEKIARSELRDPARWREIMRLNGMKNARELIAGTKIRLPEVALAR